MARKSRKHQNTPVLLQPNTEAVGYIRLSVSNTEESQSIENQKFIIQLWADQHQLPISRFYIDDGFSGTSFERPAFKSMIQDIIDGKVNCVIMKDLSRLGRDLISTGYYIEDFFPSRNVRFVSVNDCFNTIDGINNVAVKAYSDVRVPLTNAFNEQIPVENKKQVEVTLDMKAKLGAFIGPRAPFGYMKSETDHSRIIPDPLAAAIVRTIFKLASNNTGITAIVRYLNEHSIPTPIQYAKANGLEGNYHDGNGSWNSRSVKYILTNRTYTGVLVQGKEKRVVEGTHEALVDPDTFETIQKALQAKMFNITSRDQSTENVLKGKIICGCCGGKMQRKHGTNHADWYFFTCNTNNRLGAGRCTGMYIREEDIFSALYHQLKLYIKATSVTTPMYDRKVSELNGTIMVYSQQYENALMNSMQHYERFVMNEIEPSEFRIFQAKMQEAKTELDIAQTALKEYQESFQRYKRMQKVCSKELPLSEIIDEINTITVEAGKKVAVHWKCEI